MSKKQDLEQDHLLFTRLKLFKLYVGITDEGLAELVGVNVNLVRNGWRAKGRAVKGEILKSFESLLSRHELRYAFVASILREASFCRNPNLSKGQIKFLGIRRNYYYRIRPKRHQEQRGRPKKKKQSLKVNHTC